MPSMADITVKKNDGTTDIVYTGISPSAGNGVPAVWRSDSVGSTAGQRPELRLWANDLASKPGGRKMQTTYFYPYTVTDSTTSLVSRVDTFEFRGEWKIPAGVIPDAITAEAVSQLANLLASALVKSCVKSGYSAT
jgi:hypothetical protein